MLGPELLPDRLDLGLLLELLSPRLLLDKPGIGLLLDWLDLGLPLYLLSPGLLPYKLGIKTAD